MNYDEASFILQHVFRLGSRQPSGRDDFRVGIIFIRGGYEANVLMVGGHGDDNLDAVKVPLEMTRWNVVTGLVMRGGLPGGYGRKCQRHQPDQNSTCAHPCLHNLLAHSNAASERAVPLATGSGAHCTCQTSVLVKVFTERQLQDALKRIELESVGATSSPARIRNS